MIKRPALTVLSAFTGAGGLDLGLECAGFRTVGCVELNDEARETILANRPDWNLLDVGDIIDVAETLRPSDLGLARKELSVLAGGPPCQPFSTAAQWTHGRRTGLGDDRALTLLAFLDLAEQFLPAVILVENVVGFARGACSAVPMIESMLGEINKRHGTLYTLETAVLQAADFGVPQRRRRAILLSRRDGKPFAWPQPTHTDRPVRAYDAIGTLSRVALTRRRSGYWADLLPTIPAGMNYLYHTAKGGGLSLFGDRRWFWSFLLKLAPEEPSWTIPASPGPSTGPFHWDNRPLAPLELARLQTFPRTWKFAGSERQQQRQIGNATPPLLGEVIGRAVARDVFGRRPRGEPKLAIRRHRFVPPPLPPQPVPRKYLELIGFQADHPGTGEGPGARRRVLRENFASLLITFAEQRANSPDSHQLEALRADTDQLLP